MSVFAEQPTSPRPRVSVILMLTVLCVAAASALLGRRDLNEQTAVQLKAVGTPIPEPTGTMFPEPTPIVWEGYVTRTLAGGRGLEIKSVMATSGYFFAYTDIGFPASLSENPVRIHGQWLGISCEYGRCAPEVEAESWESLPIVAE